MYTEPPVLYDILWCWRP